MQGRHGRLMRKLCSRSLLRRISIVGAVYILPFSNEAFAQTNDEVTRVLPAPIIPSADENGVSLSTGALDISGPEISIGDPEKGGLYLKPTIAGSGIYGNLYAPCVTTNSDCFATGFYQAPTNLSGTLTINGLVWEAPLNGTIQTNTPATVSVAGKLARFINYNHTLSGFVEQSPVVGRSLSYSSGAPIDAPLDTGERMTFTDSDGTLYIFYFVDSWAYPDFTGHSSVASNNLASHSFPIRRIIYPNGRTIDFYYSIYASTNFLNPAYKLKSITTNSGFMMKFQDASFTMAGSVISSKPVVAINSSTEYCNPTADSCDLSGTWSILQGGRTEAVSGTPGPTYRFNFPFSYTAPDGGVTSVNFDYNTFKFSVSRPNGDVEQYGYDYNYAVTASSYPNPNCPISPNQNMSLAGLAKPYLMVACPLARIKTYSDGLNTWTYNTSFSYALTPGQTDSYNVISTNIARIDPLGNSRTSSAVPAGGITQVVNELNATTLYAVDPVYSPNEGRVNSITFPDGNSTSYSYDQRGNITAVVRSPKPSSGLAATTTSYSYPATCSNWKICNKPVSVTDPTGSVTSLSWDPNSGEILTETAPTPAGGVAPVKRYSYAQRVAWVKNNSGTYTASSNPIWLLDTMRTCISTATVGNACVGGSADEVVTTYDYGPNSGPNNLSLRGVVVTANGTSIRTCYGYDKNGRRISQTKPLGTGATCP